MFNKTIIISVNLFIMNKTFVYLFQHIYVFIIYVLREFYYTIMLKNGLNYYL